MFGGTKTLRSSGWPLADRQQRSRAIGFKSIAKRLLLSAFHVIDRVPEEFGVLLTFDDGPDPEVTPRVLDLLAEYDAKAVFFVVGDRIPRAPKMLTRIIDEGHLIGNHTFHHPLDYVPSLPRYIREIHDCQKAIERVSGVIPGWFRAPLGALSVGSLLGPTILGLRSLLWSIDVDDWKLRCESDAIDAGGRLASQVVPGDVVLLHDDNRYVLTLLRTALPSVKQRMAMNTSLARLAVG